MSVEIESKCDVKGAAQNVNITATLFSTNTLFYNLCHNVT